MRITVVIILWVVIVGGLWLYLHRPGRTVIPAHAVEARAAEGAYVCEFTPTFSLAADPFALKVDEGEKPVVLSVKLNGGDLVRLTDKVESGKAIKVDVPRGAVKESNELLIEANPPAEMFEQAGAIRARVFANGLELKDETVWSEPGGRVIGTVRFDGRADRQEKERH